MTSVTDPIFRIRDICQDILLWMHDGEWPNLISDVMDQLGVPERASVCCVDRDATGVAYSEQDVGQTLTRRNPCQNP